MKIYLDVCCLNRPFDDQTQDRIRLEAEAVLIILKYIELGKMVLINSDVIFYEISKIPNLERREKIFSLISKAKIYVKLWHYPKIFSQTHLNLYHTRAENDITFSSP